MTRAELDALIEEATVDAYNDHEQITGLFTMLDEHLAVPFLLHAIFRRAVKVYGLPRDPLANVEDLIGRVGAGERDA